MLYQLVIFIGVLIATDCWVINVSHVQVAKKLTVNVTLKCEYDNNDNQAVKLEQITRMRIMKYEVNKWTTIATISNVDPVQTTFADASVTGHVGGLTDSFLKIRFDLASDETIGKFKCEVDGYDVNDDIEPVLTPPVDIAERGVSYDDILDIIYGMQKDEKNDFLNDQARLSVMEKSLSVLNRNDKSRITVIDDITNRIASLKKNFLRVTSALDNKQLAILSDIQVIKNANKVKAWPEGTYAILEPKNGCPISKTFNWLNTVVRIATQIGRSNKDQVSNPLNLIQPVNETVNPGDHHYVRMRSCTKAMAVAGPAWPKGKYCIQSYDTAVKCPINFFHGTITVDRYNTGPRDTIQNLKNYVANSDTTQLNYCCRSDGSENTPISLPADHEFYLYRYGGKCQQVEDMHVSNEWISLHTGPKDAYSNNFHPDGHIKPLRFELCYYTPK